LENKLAENSSVVMDDDDGLIYLREGAIYMYARSIRGTSIDLGTEHTTGVN